MTFTPRLNRFAAWGAQGPDPVSTAERDLIAQVARHRFGVDHAPRPAVEPAAVVLRDPRVPIPDGLSSCMTTARADRLAHAWGKSFPDLARAFLGLAPHSPDAVAYPRDETDIERVLEWASESRVAVIPYGGGSSVVGGVTPDIDDDYTGSISLDLQRLDQVLEVDPVSRAARVQAGVLGPALADQLRPHELALRHYPQSYQFSSVGGWIATRAGGHYATGPTHIDDFVESLRMVSPAGVWQSRRLPASGAGPDPDRILLGSEGTLGVITEAWLRLQPRPTYRARATAQFDSLPAAVAAVRAIAQSGLQPSNLRLLDRVEALNSLVADGTHEVLVMGFESADHDVSPALARALECCRDHHGTSMGSTDSDKERSESAADSWRDSFTRMPFYRDVLMSYGIVSETFETAVTWDRFFDLYDAVSTSVGAALSAEGLTPASVSCRFTHVYPDGVAPYFTVLARGTPGELDRQWWPVKQAAGEAIESAGGTITHHHAVGRDHVPWYRRERPGPFGAAMRSLRAELDPVGIMNPRVLGW
ncbi:MAG: FAD-binding oxidoreductase [Candidatus Nanopelagicales bacterium]